ncbi:hypothetical protein B0H15DRAFT_157850 [Mycena belliarum]|uniref:DUF6697 domain-containing protein n=1 Tax=Mycena belliarum TaxID=1033014 RepID=A0AAD6U822_9AGAR|nr:hypothetical protein B0H15DRAFT_157850 [Mycena belliae]
MDGKVGIERNSPQDEIKRLQRDNQRLRAELERVRWERDDAETRFASSQTKVAELEHKVRKQGWRIADLEAERDVPEMPENLRPLPLVAPAAPDVIEISDSEDCDSLTHVQTKRSPSPVPKAEIPPRQVSEASSSGRQLTDFVSVAVKKDTTPAAQLKRVRSPSPLVNVHSSSMLLEESRGPPEGTASQLPSRSPSPPPMKRQRRTTKITRNSRSPSPPLTVEQPKKEAPDVLRHVVDIYLKDTPPLKIDPAPIDTLRVPRKFLRLEYGGCDQQFLQHFTPPDGATRGRSLVFPQADLNPFLPAHPGAAGLIFASRREITKDPPWALFCKDHSCRTAVWQYMGDYENDVAGQLTAAQFRSQRPEVKQQWGRHIAKSKHWPVYVGMRARIALRKAGLPLEPEREAREIAKIKAKSGKGMPLEPETVVDALSAGDERIDIIRMRCVSYDHTFAADMARRLEVRKTPKAVGRRAARKGEQATPTKGKRKQARIKAPLNKSDSDFSVESEASESGASFVHARPRRRRGTLQSPPPEWDDGMSDVADLSDPEGEH